MTNNDVIEKLIPIYTEIDLLDSRCKASSCRRKGRWTSRTPFALAKVAKAKVQQKLEELKEKTDALSDLIDSVQNSN